MSRDTDGKVFTVRGTGSEYDGLKLVCGSVHSFVYSSKEKGIYNQLIPCRPVLSVDDDPESEEAIKGLWLEDGYLIPEEEQKDEYVPGKHIKTISVAFSNFSITIVEREDVLQCSIKDIDSDKVLKSCYKDRVHFGSIKESAEKCSSANDVSGFIQLLERLN